MSEKSVEDMSVEELEDEIRALRDRRAQARERRATAPSDAEKKEKKAAANEVTGDLGSLLDDILGDST